jgi:PKD repeat protein
MNSRHYFITVSCLIVLVLAAVLAITPAVSADNIQTIIVPNTGKYPLPPLQVNTSIEPVVLNQELSTVDQPGIYRIPPGSVIILSEDGINRVFDANGIQFLAVYDTGAHHTHSVPNGAFVDSEGNVTYILSNNLLVMTIIDATEKGIATPTPAPVVASFSPMPPNEGNPPLKVQFSDYSQGTITGWDWSFGDGSSSTEQNPVHTYRVNGTYNVTLTVHGPQGNDTFTYPECITVGPRPPLARIGADPLRADYAPLTVTFTDTSLGDITAWLWDFGDGSTSAEQNPVHTYQKQGNYSASLTVSGPAGTSTMEQPVFILVGPFPPVAHFEGIYSSHPAPCSVEFMQYSEGTITQWLWDFGDGTKSAEKKPTHTYYRDGNFTVNLTVSGPEGTSRKSRSSFIHVGEPFFISADPVGIHVVGETMMLTGTTNLPAGEDLDFYVMTGSFNPGGPRFGNPSNASGTTRVVLGTSKNSPYSRHWQSAPEPARVVAGDSGNNSWFFVLDTKEFRPDEYLVYLGSTTFHDVSGSFAFTLIKGNQILPHASGSAPVTPAIQPSCTVNGTPAPTPRPAPLPVSLVILAISCVGILAVGRRRWRR